MILQKATKKSLPLSFKGERKEGPLCGLRFHRRGEVNKQHDNLHLLFHPRNVAVIGASKEEGKAGARFVGTFQRFGYEGKIFPINYKEKEIFGLKSYPSVLEVEDDIDMAIIVIPAPAVPTAIKECGLKRVKFAVIHTAGFAELGEEGEKLENSIIETARDYGMRMVGPNCMGVFCSESKVPSMWSYKPAILEKGNLSFFSQSGTIFNAISKLSYDRGLKLGKAVSIGNQADLKDIDYLRYFGQDPDTRVIIAYLEGLSDGREFLSLAKEISAHKPIIIWKAGSTEAGVKAARSHTAALAASDYLCNAAFKQAGIIRADDSDELMDMALAFSAPHLPASAKVGLMVDSGGQGVVMADACVKAGLELVSFPSEIQEQLRTFLTGHIPPFSGIANPVDLVWPDYREISKIYYGCIEIMSSVVDAIIIFTFVPYMDDNMTKSLQGLRDKFKIPIFMIQAYHISSQEMLHNYTKKGFPAFPTAERAARALSGLVRYAQFKREMVKESLEKVF